MGTEVEVRGQQRIESEQGRHLEPRSASMRPGGEARAQPACSCQKTRKGALLGTNWDSDNIDSASGTADAGDIDSPDCGGTAAWLRALLICVVAQGSARAAVGNGTGRHMQEQELIVIGLDIAHISRG